MRGLDIAKLEVKVYLGPDRSPQQLQQGRHCKYLAEAVQKHVKQGRVFPNKAQGTISHGWQPIARITAESVGKSRIQWNNDKATKLELPKEAIIQEVMERIGAEAQGPIEWCS